MNFSLPDPQDDALRDDLGLTATKHAVKNAQLELARRFDALVRAFIEEIEGRTLDLAWDAPVVAHCGHVIHLQNAPPEDDWSYFIWRSPQHGIHVLRYRFLSNFLANQTTHILSADFTLQSQKLAEADWPSALRAYLA